MENLYDLLGKEIAKEHWRFYDIDSSHPLLFLVHVIDGELVSLTGDFNQEYHGLDLIERYSAHIKALQNRINQANLS